MRQQRHGKQYSAPAPRSPRLWLRRHNPNRDKTGAVQPVTLFGRECPPQRFAVCCRSLRNRLGRIDGIDGRTRHAFAALILQGGMGVIPCCSCHARWSSCAAPVRRLRNRPGQRVSWLAREGVDGRQTARRRALPIAGRRTRRGARRGRRLRCPVTVRRPLRHRRKASARLLRQAGRVTSLTAFWTGASRSAASSAGAPPRAGWDRVSSR